MGEKDEVVENILIDEEEAKKLFLEELRNKNMEETRAFERVALEKALLEEAAKAEAAKAEAEKESEEQKALGQIASDTFNDKDGDAKDLTSADDKELNGEEVVTKVNKKINVKVINALKSALIDTAVTGVVSVAALYLFDILLRLLFGYYVVDFKAVYIIVFLIILVIYPVLMESSKHGKTLGKKFIKTEVKEREE